MRSPLSRTRNDPQVAPYTFEQQRLGAQNNAASGNANGYSSGAQKMNLTVEDLDDALIKKATIENGGVEYQLISVEIEKIAEIGLVVGQVEGQDWAFIDEILPNGMIDMHGVLKEGDRLIQAGPYSLAGFNVPTILVLIERAYDEGRKTLSFVAARAIPGSQSKKPAGNFLNGAEKNQSGSRNDPASAQTKIRTASTRAQSFLSYENVEAEEDNSDSEQPIPRKVTKM